MFLVRLRFSRLKKKIKNNPLIGTKQEDGSYTYREEGYTISYKIEESLSGERRVEWLSLKRRLGFLEIKFLKLKKSLNNFFLYQRWLGFLRLPVLLSLLISVGIFYFGLVETRQARVERLKWLVASAAGVSPKQIQYIGDGTLEISANRKTAVDRVNEPVRYTFNPFKWFFSQTGLVTRWRGESFGYVTHPVVYNEDGEVWINKEDTWRHGRFTNDRTIEWDTPQGTGIRAGKVTGHEVSMPEGKLYIPDK